jgi:GT2 family glycosyltransferase
VSVVIVNHNTATFLARCLRSLRKSTAAQESEVIVVDNASSDGSAELVSREFPEVEFVASEENVGFARGNNLGFERAQGEFVFILNPDTEVPPDCVAQLVAFMRARPDVGAAGPLIVNVEPGSEPLTDPHPAPVVHERWANRFGPVRVPHLAGPLLRGRVGDGTAFTVDWVLNAASLIRASAIRRDRLMDETFFIGTEEIELGVGHLRANGFVCAILPRARVFHYIGRSFDDRVEPNIRGYELAQAAIHYRRAEFHSPLWARVDSVLAAIDHAILWGLIVVRHAVSPTSARAMQRAIWRRLVRVDLRLARGSVPEALTVDAEFRAWIEDRKASGARVASPT